MKKSITVLSVLALSIFTCSNLYALESMNFQQGPAKKPATTSKAAASTKPQNVEKGKNLISKSDCLACHKLDAKVVGPAYNDVAKKYPATNANIELLASKVISGGAGNWGQVPMSPHASLSVADAKEMVKYILSLKSK